MIRGLEASQRQICILQSLPHTIRLIIAPVMTNRPIRPQAFRSSGRLLPRAWACTDNEDHWTPSKEAARKPTIVSKTDGSASQADDYANFLLITVSTCFHSPEIRPRRIARVRSSLTSITDVRDILLMMRALTR